MGPMPAQLSLPHAVLTDADSDADSADSFHIAPSSSAPAPPRRPASWLAGPLLIPASPAVAGQAVVEHAVLEETQAMCCSSSERSASGGSSSGGSSRSTSAARARPVARTAWPDKRPLLAPPSKAAACCDSGSGTLLPAQALACHQAAAYITRDGERCSRISRQAGRTLRQAEEDARRRIAEAMCLQQQQLSRPGTADALGNGEAREGTRRLWRHTSAAVAPSQDGLQPQPRLPGLAGAGAARASHGGGGPA